MSKQLGISVYLFVFFSILLLQSFAYAMLVHIDHDEHQYLASGYLLAKDGLLPYLHYPYFQLPNITFFYALLAVSTDYLLFGARLLTAFLGWGIGFLLYRIILHLFEDQKLWQKHSIASAFTLLFFLNPLFNYAAWKVWTHSLPLLFTLLAYWQLIKHWNQNSFSKAVFWSGFFLSLALGTRISYAFFIPAFLLFIVLQSKSWITFRNFAFGGILGGLPSIFFLIFIPQKFWYNVVQYHTEVDAAYFKAMNYDRSFLELWQYFINRIQQNGNEYFLWLFVLGFAAFSIFSILKKKRPKPIFYFTLLLLPCALAGAFSKVITFPQYYFSVVPFVLLGLASCVRIFPIRLTTFLSISVALVFCVLLSKTWHFNHLRSPSDWKSLGVHRESSRLKTLIKDKKVLTLSPLYVLEAGGQIYPAFANGPFAWRTSHLIQKEKRKEIGIIGNEDLEEYLITDLPAAILTGFEGRHDDKVKEFARKNNFIPLQYQHKKKYEIWLPKNNFKTKTIIQKPDTIEEHLTTAYSQSIRETVGNRINSNLPIIFQASIQIKPEQAFKEERLHLVLDIRRNGKSLFWKGEVLTAKKLRVGAWQALKSPTYLFHFNELEANDELVLFLWNPQKVNLDLKNLSLEEMIVIE